MESLNISSILCHAHPALLGVLILRGILGDICERRSYNILMMSNMMTLHVNNRKSLMIFNLGICRTPLTNFEI